MDLYQNSWKLYKAESEGFDDDLNYYLDFCKSGDGPCLELFAGYGRVSNKLVDCGLDLETVELNYKFSSFINLPSGKNHTVNVLDFEPQKKFGRIFAAYNSFCLLTSDQEINNFFCSLYEWLEPSGVVSLSYYHHSMWAFAEERELCIDGEYIKYIPSFDLSNAHLKRGIWVDTYVQGQKQQSYKYPTRIYEAEDVNYFSEKSNLKLINVVESFGRSSKEVEPGWIDYVLQK